MCEQVCGKNKRRGVDKALNELCSIVAKRHPDAMAEGNQIAHSHSELGVGIVSWVLGVGIVSRVLGVGCWYSELGVGCWYSE